MPSPEDDPEGGVNLIEAAGLVNSVQARLHRRWSQGDLTLMFGFEDMDCEIELSDFLLRSWGAMLKTGTRDPWRQVVACAATAGADIERLRTLVKENPEVFGDEELSFILSGGLTEQIPDALRRLEIVEVLDACTPWGWGFCFFERADGTCGAVSVFSEKGVVLRVASEVPDSASADDVFVHFYGSCGLREGSRSLAGLRLTAEVAGWFRARTTPGLVDRVMFAETVTS